MQLRIRQNFISLFFNGHPDSRSCGTRISIHHNTWFHDFGIPDYLEPTQKQTPRGHSRKIYIY